MNSLDQVFANCELKTTSNGYIVARGAKGHPLADSYNKVPLHRVVLWDHLGQPEASPCHWCGFLLPWKSSSYRHCINVDHLDGNKSNNTIANLQSSCWWCNTNRTWAATNASFWAALISAVAHINPNERPQPFDFLRHLIVGLDEAEALELTHHAFHGMSS